MLRFDDGNDFAEIDLVGQEKEKLPSEGDAYLSIRVSSAGFSGQNDLWVLAPSVRSFCQSLIALEHDRNGVALLESISPDELRLIVRSIDRLGHMAIEGTTGRWVQKERSRFWHSVSFGFEFDPSQLVRATNMDWVRRNGEAICSEN